MFPPADDPPDLGIPPNRGPLPVRRNPNSKPNPRVRSGYRRNAQPQGIRGVRAHWGAPCEILVLMIMHVSLFQECPFLNSNICFLARRILEWQQCLMVCFSLFLWFYNNALFVSLIFNNAHFGYFNGNSSIFLVTKPGGICLFLNLCDIFWKNNICFLIWENYCQNGCHNSA